MQIAATFNDPAIIDVNRRGVLPRSTLGQGQACCPRSFRSRAARALDSSRNF